MGFFDEKNTPFETAWFSIMAALSLACFPFGVRLGRRFPQILVTKLVPVLCLLLAYENTVQALSNELPDESPVALVARTTRASVIPLFLVIIFEVAYAVHKRRSVKFCGIVFDQGHRRSVEPCSWFLRNFVRIVAVMIFVVGILVNYGNIVGDDESAGGTGLVDVHDASAHLLLALLPTTGMAVIALYIAAYMWKYGNDASIVVQTTMCNGWMFPFLGTLALLAGQVPPESYFRVANETGQVLLLLSLIAVGREIGREVQAADDFSSFLEKENELETGITEHGKHTPTIEYPLGSNRVGLEGEPKDLVVASIGVEEKVEGVRKNAAAAEEPPIGHDSPAIGEEDEGVLGVLGDHNLDDVTRPMGRHAMRAVGGRGGGGQLRQRTGLFGNKKGVSLLEDREEDFTGFSENEEERHDVGRDTRPRKSGTDLIVTSPSPPTVVDAAAEENRSSAPRSGARGKADYVIY